MSFEIDDTTPKECSSPQQGYKVEKSSGRTMATDGDCAIQDDYNKRFQWQFSASPSRRKDVTISHQTIAPSWQHANA